MLLVSEVSPTLLPTIIVCLHARISINRFFSRLITLVSHMKKMRAFLRKIDDIFSRSKSYQFLKACDDKTKHEVFTG
jgi:hypothetical protein